MPLSRSPIGIFLAACLPGPIGANIGLDVTASCFRGPVTGTRSSCSDQGTDVRARADPRVGR